jgi:hypothetical protein
VFQQKLGSNKSGSKNKVHNFVGCQQDLVSTIFVSLTGFFSETFWGRKLWVVRKIGGSTNRQGKKQCGFNFLGVKPFSTIFLGKNLGNTKRTGKTNVWDKERDGAKARLNVREAR